MRSRRNPEKIIGPGNSLPPISAWNHLGPDIYELLVEDPAVGLFGYRIHSAARPRHMKPGKMWLVDFWSPREVWSVTSIGGTVHVSPLNEHHVAMFSRADAYKAVQRNWIETNKLRF